MLNFTFFGSSKFSVFCLEELKNLNILPSLVVTTPDKPTGRGLKLTPTPVKIWAEENKITCITPDKLTGNIPIADLFLVASYGKIIPKAVIDLPKFCTLNIHPSLLPKYRGPSPLQEQILNDEKEVGVSLMLIDEKMDHGPIIAQEKIAITSWPKLEDFKALTAKVGAKLFSDNLEAWVKNEIKAKEQLHAQATFTKEVEKVDGLIDLAGDPYQNFRKIQAYSMWPNAYFFVQKGEQKIRVIVKDAEFVDGKLILKKVIPEGKKEMSFEDFMRGMK
jgi:methionyl-tRNA formyltransferase